MQPRSLSHLSDHVLTQELPAAIARESSAASITLAYLAEFEARRLFVPAAFASMHETCVQVLHLSEDSTKKRLQAAHVARQFAAVLAAVADGRLHLSAVVMLATRLTPENVDTLIAATTHKSKSQIEFVLAEYFPRPDVPSSVREVAPLVAQPTSSDATAATSAPGHSIHTPPPARGSPAGRARHVPRPSVARVQVEDGGISDPALHVPAAVRREVMVRDGRQCTFVSQYGRRCSACRRLDFDHIVPLAKGGETTVANLRLLCPVHDQHEAGRIYGAGFMAEKRAEGLARGCAKRAGQEVAAHAAGGETTGESSAPGHSNARAHVEEVIPFLRALGLTKAEARRGAECCANMPEALLEERVRVALQGLGRLRFQRCTHTPDPTG